MKPRFGGAALALLIAAPAYADTLIDNVKGLTTTPFGQVVHFAALLIGDDGKVVRTYAEGETIDVRAKYRVDGKGRVMLPGNVFAPPVNDSLVHRGLALLAAENHLTGPLPKPGPRDRLAAVEAVQNMYLSHGITTVADMNTSVEDWLTYRLSGDQKRLRMRIFAYANGVGPMVVIGQGAATPWLYDDHLRMSGVILDGRAPQSGAVSVIKNDDTRLRNEMSLAAFEGFQVAIRTDTPKELTRAQSAITELQQTYEHAQWRLLGADIVIEQAYPDPFETVALHIRSEAKRLLIDDRIGLLAKGYAADFTLRVAGKGLSADGLSETWVGGVKVYERANDQSPAAAGPSNSTPPIAPN